MASTIVVLFGYESSIFTIKHDAAASPQSFHLTYRKIPVLAIGRDLYCDTSLICEALENFFPEGEGFKTLYPPAQDGRTYRPLIRGFASYWTDRPLFRVTTGLMPASIWRSSFGTDRAQLIGHKLDPDKLEKKLPENLLRLDMQLSMLEPLFTEINGPWIFSTSSPSMADVSVYYQLLWGSEIAAGHLVYNLTAGGASNTELEGTAPVFNAQRYPGIWAWFHRLQLFFDQLPSTEDETTSFETVIEQMKKAPSIGQKSILLPTPRSTHSDLDSKTGIKKGILVSVTPDDTGRDDPTKGTLLAISPEEIVIKPEPLDSPPAVETRIHFPRLGFVVRPVSKASL